jgi:hypothetical protein
MKTEPSFATCSCNNCSAHIQFEVTQAGQTVECPQCKLETLLFIPPTPVQPKQPTRRNVVRAVIIIAVSFVAVALFGFWNAPRRTHENVPSSERHYSEWHKQAEKNMIAECTNVVTGCSRIIEARLWATEDDPNKWTGDATVEFMNRVGGADRTNVPFRFLLTGDTIACLLDNQKLDERQEKERARQQDRDDWEKHLDMIHADFESKERDIHEKTEHSRKLLDYARQEALSRSDAGSVAGPRIWSFQAGGKVEGTFVRFQGTNNIIVRSLDGGEYTMALVLLSEYDNDYVELTLKH